MTGRTAVAGAQSFSRTINVLRLVAAHSDRGIRLAEIIRLAGITRPTGYRMLQALEHEGLVCQDPSGTYFIGPDAFLLGLAGADRYAMTDEMYTSLNRLVRISGDTALFAVRRGDHAIFIGREEGTYPVRTYIAGVGTRRPLGIGAASLAILSTVADGEVEAILANNEEELRLEHAEFPPNLIRQLVHETRERGYAINPGWEFAESWGISIPAVDQSGRCHGSFTLAGVSSRIDPRRSEVAEILSVEAARFAERALAKRHSIWASSPS